MKTNRPMILNFCRVVIASCIGCYGLLATNTFAAGPPITFNTDKDPFVMPDIEDVHDQLGSIASTTRGYWIKSRRWRTVGDAANNSFGQTICPFGISHSTRIRLRYDHRFGSEQGAEVSQGGQAWVKSLVYGSKMAHYLPSLRLRTGLGLGVSYCIKFQTPEELTYNDIAPEVEDGNGYRASYWRGSPGRYLPEPGDQLMPLSAVEDHFFGNGTAEPARTASSRIARTAATQGTTQSLALYDSFGAIARPEEVLNNAVGFFSKIGYNPFDQTAMHILLNDPLYSPIDRPVAEVKKLATGESSIEDIIEDATQWIPSGMFDELPSVSFLVDGANDLVSAIASLTPLQICELFSIKDSGFDEICGLPEKFNSILSPVPEALDRLVHSLTLHERIGLDGSQMTNLIGNAEEVINKYREATSFVEAVNSKVKDWGEVICSNREMQHTFDVPYVDQTVTARFSINPCEHRYEISF